MIWRIDDLINKTKLKLNQNAKNQLIINPFCLWWNRMNITTNGWQTKHGYKLAIYEGTNVLTSFKTTDFELNPVFQEKFAILPYLIQHLLSGNTQHVTEFKLRTTCLYLLMLIQTWQKLSSILQIKSQRALHWTFYPVSVRQCTWIQNWECTAGCKLIWPQPNWQKTPIYKLNKDASTLVSRKTKKWLRVMRTIIRHHKIFSYLLVWRQPISLKATKRETLHVHWTGWVYLRAVSIYC